MAEVLGRADDHGVGVRLLRRSWWLGQRVPADRAELTRYPGLGAAEHQLLQVTREQAGFAVG